MKIPTSKHSELSFKTTFAGQVGLSIANIRLREALRTQSMRDALTGLYNRRYLEEILDREVRRGGASWTQSMGVLMIDLDHFKNLMTPMATMREMRFCARRRRSLAKAFATRISYAASGERNLSSSCPPRIWKGPSASGAIARKDERVDVMHQGNRGR